MASDAPQLPLNNSTLGGKTIYDPPKAQLGLNSFTMRTGASRYGRGVFLLVRKDYDALRTALSPGSLVPLVLQAGTNSPGLTLQVLLAGADVFSTTAGPSTGISSPDDLVKVTVLDQRALNFVAIKKYYNIVSAGSYVNSQLTCYSSTLNPDTMQPWNWHDLIVDSSIMPVANFPTDTPLDPYNIQWDNVPAAYGIDEIAARFYNVVAFDYTQSPGQDVYLKNPDDTFPSNDALFDVNNWVGQVLDKKQLLSGDVAERAYNRLPNKVGITYPGWMYSGDPYKTNRLYQKSVDTKFTKAAEYTLPIHVGSIPAIFPPSGSTPLNNSDLDEFAPKIAAAYVKWAQMSFFKFEIAGIWPFKPDGYFRQITWTTDGAGARTTVAGDNEFDWTPEDSITSPLYGVQPQQVNATNGTVGLGGINFQWLNIPIPFVIIGNATMSGVYTAKQMVPGLAFDPTTAGPFMNNQISISITTGDTVYLINAREANKSATDPSQWDITTEASQSTPNFFPPYIFWGTFFGTAPDGKAMYIADMRQSESCS